MKTLTYKMLLAAGLLAGATTAAATDFQVRQAEVNQVLQTRIEARMLPLLQLEPEFTPAPVMPLYRGVVDLELRLCNCVSETRRASTFNNKLYN